MSISDIFALVKYPSMKLDVTLHLKTLGIFSSLNLELILPVFTSIAFYKAGHLEDQHLPGPTTRGKLHLSLLYGALWIILVGGMEI